jgi:hypothetical protein
MLMALISGSAYCWKLLKNTYLNGPQLSTIGSDNSPQDMTSIGNDAFDKSLQMSVLGQKKESAVII